MRFFRHTMLIKGRDVLTVICDKCDAIASEFVDGVPLCPQHTVRCENEMYSDERQEKEKMKREEAEKMICQIGQWLGELAETENSQKTLSQKMKTGSDTQAAKMARDFCEILLNASAADGEGGCKLCKS